MVAGATRGLHKPRPQSRGVALGRVSVGRRCGIACPCQGITWSFSNNVDCIENYPSLSAYLLGVVLIDHHRHLQFGTDCCLSHHQQCPITCGVQNTFLPPLPPPSPRLSPSHSDQFFRWRCFVVTMVVVKLDNVVRGGEPRSRAKGVVVPRSVFMMSHQ